MSLFFLPGAAGGAAFWHPVGEKLAQGRPHHFFSWPGLGIEPPEPGIASLDDLVRRVLAKLDEHSGPADLVAQSMGGLVAVKAALAAPKKVRRLVLAVTSAGVPMPGAQDWRPLYRDLFPKAGDWIADPQPDLSQRLKTLKAPTLLLWGDQDPISPVSVGETLRALLPASSLHIIEGGGHDLAITHAYEVAALIASHLFSL